MRRLLIQFVLPTGICLLPLAVASLVAAAVPSDAQGHYLDRIRTSGIDWLILGLGFSLFTAQILLSWQALRWEGMKFNERPDRWLTHLATAAEWFPLLGLIGTVAAILQTFYAIDSQHPNTREIIRSYAPAITATGSGLFMALINILPTWVVLIGRDLIQSLAGGFPTPPPTPPEA